MPLLVLVAAAVLVNHRAECTAVVFKKIKKNKKNKNLKFFLKK